MKRLFIFIMTFFVCVLKVWANGEELNVYYGHYLGDARPVGHYVNVFPVGNLYDSLYNLIPHKLPNGLDNPIYTTAYQDSFLTLNFTWSDPTDFQNHKDIYYGKYHIIFWEPVGSGYQHEADADIDFRDADYRRENQIYTDNDFDVRFYSSEVVFYHGGAHSSEGTLPQNSGTIYGLEGKSPNTTPFKTLFVTTKTGAPAITCTWGSNSVDLPANGGTGAFGGVGAHTLSVPFHPSGYYFSKWTNGSLVQLFYDTLNVQTDLDYMTYDTICYVSSTQYNTITGPESFSSKYGLFFYCTHDGGAHSGFFETTINIKFIRNIFMLKIMSSEFCL